MQLSMLANAPADLPMHEDTMTTGLMGDCISVIVLWDLEGGTRYAHMRGWHGMGGIQAIDFDQLFYQVPDHTTTQIILVASRLYMPAAPGGQAEERRLAAWNALLERTRDLIKRRGDGTNRFDHATIRLVGNLSNAAVNRQAQVTQA